MHMQCIQLENLSHGKVEDSSDIQVLSKDLGLKGGDDALITFQRKASHPEISTNQEHQSRPDKTNMTYKHSTNQTCCIDYPSWSHDEKMAEQSPSCESAENVQRPDKTASEAVAACLNDMVNKRDLQEIIESQDSM